MNFSPFGSHFPSSIPTIHQFAAKFSPHDAGAVAAGNQNAGDNARYHASAAHFSQHHAPIGMPVKYRPEQQATVQSQMMKQYAAAAVPGNQPGNHYAYVEQKQRYHGDQSMPQDLCQQMANDKDKRNDQDKQEGEYSGQQQQQQQQQQVGGQQQVSAWQTLAAPGSAVADYLSHLTPSTLHLSLNHFLKYSAESIKKEAELPAQPPGPSGKKKKKKKAAKEKKPRPKPGEIRLTTALDGSTLFCCPECNIAYPDKELLEQHLLGHTLERRFVCDICGAGLKRKDHLTRHKQSHNPERPYVCTVCLKAFKRKEQLTLHFVIHSGEKRHVCSECGKGFYRKDHLRKHTRSHIARRVKAELSQGGGAMQGGGDMS